MAEEVVGVDDEVFRTRRPVPKRCQEIRQIKIDGANRVQDVIIKGKH